jgi:ribosomal protein S18 acetylase RimI-like enzyme
MASPYHVRSAQRDDHDAITDLNCRLAEETESRSLKRDTVSAGVLRGLQLPGDVLYLVAEQGGRVVGQLMLTREWSDWRNGWMAWLQSVYVLPEARRLGIFRSLLDHAIVTSRQQKDVVALRLYVEDENTVAQETYLRLGFVDGHYRVMEMLL